MRKSGRWMTSGARRNVKKRKQKNGGTVYQIGKTPSSFRKIRIKPHAKMNMITRIKNGY